MQVIAEHGAAFSTASLKAMPYLEAVMKETQRRYPIVGGVFRKALRSFELPGGYHIPKVRLPVMCRLLARSTARIHQRCNVSSNSLLGAS